MKYRGEGGWLHDGSTEPRRYQNRDVTKGPRGQSREEKKLLDKCPNCDFSVSWRRMEHYCDYCGWGKSKDNSNGDNIDGNTVLGCCGMIGATVILTLVGTGMGYGIGDLGGMFIGLGLGLALPVVAILVAFYDDGEKRTKTPL